MAKTGWVVSALVALFLLVASAAPKFLGAPAAVDSLSALGWPDGFLGLLGAIEVIGVVLFLIPRTGLIGAVVLTGLIGGAVASHLRVGSPLFTHTLFGLYLGMLLWLGLALRDRRLREYLAARSAPSD